MSTIKIKAPPAIEPDGPWHWKNIKTGKSGLYEEDPRKFGVDIEHPEYQWARLPSAAQLAARDAQWQEMCGPVVEALQTLIDNGGIGPEQMFRNARAALSAITEEAPQQHRLGSQLARRMPLIDSEDPWLSGDDMMGSSG